MPITLCVNGIPVASGETVVYGTVTSEGADYLPVTLVFSKEGWHDLSPGSYSLDVYYDSFVE